MKTKVLLLAAVMASLIGCAPSGCNRQQMQPTTSGQTTTTVAIPYGQFVPNDCFGNQPATPTSSAVQTTWGAVFSADGAWINDFGRGRAKIQHVDPNMEIMFDKNMKWAWKAACGNRLMPFIPAEEPAPAPVAEQQEVPQPPQQPSGWRMPTLAVQPSPMIPAVECLPPIMPFLCQNSGGYYMKERSYYEQPRCHSGGDYRPERCDNRRQWYGGGNNHQQTGHGGGGHQPTPCATEIANGRLGDPARGGTGFHPTGSSSPAPVANAGGNTGYRPAAAAQQRRAAPTYGPRAGFQPGGRVAPSGGGGFRQAGGVVQRSGGSNRSGRQGR